MLYFVQLFDRLLRLVSNCLIWQFELNNCLNTIQRVTSYWKLLFQLYENSFPAGPGSSSNIFSEQRNKLGKALFEGNIEFLWLNSSFGHRYFLPPSQFDFLTQFHIVKSDLMKMIIMIRRWWLYIYWCRYIDVNGDDDDDYNDDDDELIIKRIVAVQALILL